MTFYQKHLERMKATVFGNEAQLDMVLRARRYIHQHYREELDLATLAEAHRVSRFHMLRLFKRYHGQTPGQYLTNHRIQRAKVHLEDGLAIAETCYAVGFKSPGSFSTLFKRKTGRSPRQYQKAQFSRSGQAVHF